MAGFETQATLKMLERRGWASQIGFNVIFTEAGIEAARDPGSVSARKKGALARTRTVAPRLDHLIESAAAKAP